MNRIKDIVISTIALTVIAAAVTAAIAGTNALTADTIAERNAAAETAARMEVIEADAFEESTVTVDGETVTYYKAIKDGEEVGAVFTTEAVGKSAGLIVMTGIAADGEITGVKVVDDNETAGYVKKVEKGGFLSALLGKQAKPLTLNSDVDAVSQATKTSGGILKAVNAAIHAYQAVSGGEQGE